MGQPGTMPTFGFFKINFLIFIVCISWVIVLLITPAIAAEDTIHFGPKGFTGLDEHYQEIENIDNPFSRVVYHSGDRMCHMKEPRSLTINGNQMSYCSRCFAIFFGLALGAAITSFVVFDLKWWLLLVGIIPIGLDGGLQLITPYESNNVLRLFTGGLFGAVTTLTLGIVMVEFSQSAKYWMTNKIWYKNYMKKYPNNVTEISERPNSDNNDLKKVSETKIKNNDVLPKTSSRSKKSKDNAQKKKTRKK